jgi:hypothetical protein
MAALDGVFQLLASALLMIEYEAVLTKPEHLAAIGLTSRDFGIRVIQPSEAWKQGTKA